MTHPADALFEGIPAVIPPEEMCRIPLTVIGGFKDHFVAAESSVDWYKYVVDGPANIEDIEAIYKPDLVGISSSNSPTEIHSPAKFRLFLNKDGGHFDIFDTKNGGSEWNFGIISQTCLSVSTASM